MFDFGRRRIVQTPDALLVAEMNCGEGDLVLSYLDLELFPVDLEEGSFDILIQVLTATMPNPFDPPKEDPPCEE
ncbi:hypothetical protein [Glycomyces buryatensis]|uniref:Uncharacterized protein n=1 Tax=Glycomyces buryatensis TaxID=2570927 RepID=A0A4S8Q293_9ACTN|nr:hypothetical protein [Glycomyces buryatensis]THV34699.1 hypothetical protein FAB82_23920 [Glycomyces buryatensis]